MTYKMKDLLDKKLQYICRSCDLIDIGFGDLVKKTRKDGKDVIVPSYAIHIQSPFRVTDKNGIIVGSDDLYFSIENTLEEDILQKETTLFDQRVKNLLSIYDNEIVKGIFINNTLDVKIELTNITIEIFSTSTNDGEMWRYLQPYCDDTEHLVATGLGIELQ